MKRYASLLLIVGLAQMVGDLAHMPALKGFGAATMISPAPKVFSSVQGLETYSTRFFIRWTDVRNQAHELELTAELCAGIRGPYNRRNVYGAALAYGPVLANDPHGRPMLRSVLQYGLLGDAPLLRELGIDSTGISKVSLRYEPLAGTNMGSLPSVIEVPLR
jgi:hypothetical protein